MLKTTGLTKTFSSNGGDFTAVDNVSLSIEQGDIYGVIGYSGAGKSTLVRCLNFLETPTAGTIEIDGFGTLRCEKGNVFHSDESNPQEEPVSPAKLRKLRSSIGMIFQHFNLLDRSTVFENVAYPLRHTGKSTQDIEAKVTELLELVDLKDKAKSFPAELSGGQKQRVAIARALANDPKILLSDEATSALDPEATASVLALLKDINARLGLTIVIITHEMSVIKTICNKVTVMEDGKAVESGTVYEIFSNPHEEITRKFVSKGENLESLDVLREKYGTEGILAKLTFDDKSVNDELIADTAKQFDVHINILLANIEWLQGKPLGHMVVQLKGTQEITQNVIEYWRSRNVRTEVIGHGPSANALS